jgi:hypothetical protein
MGQAASTNAQDKLAQKPAEVPLDTVISFAYETRNGVEPVVLFAKKLFADPCSLIGRSVIDVATESAGQGNASSFAVGVGPCDQCTVPTLFWWVNGDWRATEIPQPGDLNKAIEGYAKPRGLNAMYHLLADEDLIITQVVRAVTRDGDVLRSAPVCPAPTPVPVAANGANGVNSRSTQSIQGKQMQEVAQPSNNNSFWFWLIIIVLILLLIIAIVYASRK